MNQINELGERDGYWEGTFTNGNISYKGNYINGEEDGYWEDYHSKGNLYYKGNFIKGKQDGYWWESYAPDQHSLHLNI